MRGGNYLKAFVSQSLPNSRFLPSRKSTWQLVVLHQSDGRLMCGEMFTVDEITETWR